MYCRSCLYFTGSYILRKLNYENASCILENNLCELSFSEKAVSIDSMIIQLLVY